MNKTTKAVSIKDVANIAGVSTAAVSKALNNKADISSALRDKIFAICDKLGYQVNTSIQDLARKGRTGRNHNIAFVVVAKEFADPAYSRAIDGIAKSISDFNYNLTMVRLDGNEKSIQHFPPVLRDGRVDGFIVTGDLSDEIMSTLKKINKPYIILGNYNEKIAEDAVRVEINYNVVIFKFVRELKKAGKSRIAYFAENLGNFLESDLLASFREAMKKNQIELDEKCIYSVTDRFGGAFERLKPVFIEKNMPFDSIICMDFRCAQEIANLIFGRNGLEKKPEILIAAARPFSYYKLMVPAIYCDADLNESSYMAVKSLIEMITKGESYPHKIELVPQIIVND